MNFISDFTSHRRRNLLPVAADFPSRRRRFPVSPGVTAADFTISPRAAADFFFSLKCFGLVGWWKRKPAGRGENRP
ncbi:unnamed protein product [Arabis nemorensis]|uniref:Uncharacterized protein n=1 Tax=Arabis nemorensis TaxID=586526 RepID=A0A565C8K7_9BRAS|nr:unnamed protein product [Arabis nemorensis]